MFFHRPSMTSTYDQLRVLRLRKRRNFIQVLKVDILHTSIREFQRQAHSNRLKMDYVNHGSEGFRREQARLHEDLAQREEALRETHIRSIHEVEELKRAQKMRIDELSRNQLKECHATFQELIFTNTGDAGKNEFLERCQRISRCRVDLQWKSISRSESVGNCSKSLWYAEPRPKPAI